MPELQEPSFHLALRLRYGIGNLLDYESRPDYETIGFLMDALSAGAVRPERLYGLIVV